MSCSQLDVASNDGVAMFFMHQTAGFLATWTVSGTKSKVCCEPVAYHAKQTSSSLPPELLFWIWAVVSASVFLFAVWALFSNLDGAFLHLPSCGRPLAPRRICPCGYKADSD